MSKKRAIVTVTNDLYTDQRVDKICRYLVSQQVEVVLVGRHLPTSLDLEKRIYSTHRLKLWFTKGPLFYVEYNIRLFFFLLFQKFDFLVSNDLDTLFACDLAATSKGKKIVYDSHEYFTEVPELQNRKIIKKLWEAIEIMTFRNLTRTYTVNDSIAKIYNEKYKMNFRVIKNLPELKSIEKTKSKKDLQLPEDKFILILQGAGINIQRGAEELIEAMRFLDNCFLIIIGSGDVFPLLKNKLLNEVELNQNIRLVDKVPYHEMMQYTFNADLGFTLDKNTNPNYLYSLPNKIFDYMKAGVPIVASDLVEIGKIIREFEVGEIIKSHSPNDIANTIKNCINDKSKLEKYKQNCLKAIEELNWEKQSKVLDEIYKEVL